MSGIPEEELLGCERVIDGLHEAVQPVPDDARAAERAAARLWPAAGQDLEATQVAPLLTRAIEIGYALALRDVRDGTVTPAQPSAGQDLPAVADVPAVPAEVPTRAQVAVCFVAGYAALGFGTVACWSWMTGGPLHGRGWWLIAAGIPCMLVGLGLILGGGLGGLEAREAARKED
jgi:hypothetical protein